MEYITFCIPYYGKELVHTELLRRSIESIRLYYPTNPILVCKTSDSHLPEDLSGVEVYSTFVDGSHIYGAIELLTRVCKTKHFLICHDSIDLWNVHLKGQGLMHRDVCQYQKCHAPHTGILDRKAA